MVTDSTADSTPHSTLLQYDDAGRILNRKQGAGDQNSLTQKFEESSYQRCGTSTLAPTIARTEGTHTFSTQREFDTAGNAKSVSTGGLTWQQPIDQSGNIVQSAEPGRAPITMYRDSWGAVTKGSAPRWEHPEHHYHPTGAATQFSDPTREVTGTETDLLGRPTRVLYADGTGPTSGSSTAAHG